ncbi:hypothetical protein ACFWHR_03810 [Leucobacter sp. NPDC058333]|uniref:hypothetical protein n=1 Tax=Leucobacter sp. NPDC058333 TaxID=3346450 RepID=UPI0036480A4F
MSRPAPIRIDADTWAIMREPVDRPVAMVHRVTDVSGEARFLVLKWNVDPAKRRLTGLYPTFELAEASVLYQLPKMPDPSKPPNGGGRLP